MGCSGGKAASPNGADQGSVAAKKEPEPKAEEKKDRNNAAKKNSTTEKTTEASTEAEGGGSVGRTASATIGDRKPIMDKYKMHVAKEDIMGEGTSSICRRGTARETGEEVAIKVYKEQAKGGSKAKEVTLYKFKRQIKVLLELQEPFVPAADLTLWQDQLSNVKPSRIFMRCLDHSKDKDGNPGYDTSDNVLYVVTELGQYSLKDFLTQRRDQSKALSADSVKNMCKAVVTAMAGLHAKGFVHLDMKPENMMMFNGRLKVIDVDGCVRGGTKVSIQDSSISFSPCYCAPEWAKFLIGESEQNIEANPRLDSWSVGMTLCELVTLDAILKPQYANFLRNASSHKEAGFLFMEWLGTIRKAPIPRSVEKLDAQLMNLINEWLLVCSSTARKTCAQCLTNPYLMAAPSDKPGEDKPAVRPEEDKEVKRILRDRPEDDSNKAPLFKGSLWKLNTKGDKKKNEDFIKRDMWIAHNHSLCYFSVKEDKRLVLIDGQKLTTATLKIVNDTAKDFAFEVRWRSDDDASECTTFGVDTEDEMKEWMEKLTKTGRMDMIVTMRLGADMAEELKQFKINVKNRRQKIDEADKDNFAPVFKKKLRKVKAEGDKLKEEDWFLREMWLAKNGSLVYWSVKEDRELVYYTAQDISKATIKKVPDAQSFFPWAFQVQLPSVEGVEFAPGEFAAETAADQKEWLDQFSIAAKVQ